MFEERRRAPRYEIQSGELALLPVAISVQVLEISPAGMLLESNQTAEIGRRGRLSVNMSGQALSAEVEVRQVSRGRGNGHRIGVAFVEISPEHQQMIEHFSDERTI